MYLREVSINGFKSFAESTDIVLQPGVTAIVGPNGCGKSNIADCIRWVLGEQRPTALRGGKMQDVIFEGTKKRKPHSICEVSLTFTECEKQLGEAFHEVEIKRRVVRDGGSNYYINGKPCRLKDIGKLFMDTGVGQASYSYMVQGQIDQILSSNPAERRIIFEEAAGITRYKAQRKEALKKLSHVDTNLARVMDVMEEVVRQIGSLRRQAAKALRYKRVAHRLKHLDLALQAYKFSGVGASLKEAGQRSAQLRQEVEDLRQRVEDRETHLEKQRVMRTELYAGVGEAQQNIFDLRSGKEHADGQARFARTRIEDIQNRLEHIDREVEDIEKRKEGVSTRSQGDLEALELQLELVGTSDEKFHKRSEAFRLAQSRQAHAEAKVLNERSSIAQQEGVVEKFRTEVYRLQMALKADEVKHASLRENCLSLEEEQSGLDKFMEELAGRMDRFGTEKMALAGELEERSGKAEEHLQSFRQLQVSIQELDRDLARMAAHSKVLNNLNRKFEGYSEGAKAVLQGRLDAVLPAGEFGLLAKTIGVSRKYTRAVEALFGASLDAILVDSAEAAQRVADRLAERQLGKVCLQFPVESSERWEKNGLPKFLKPALSVVESSDFRTSQALEKVLEGCYVCDLLEDFLTYWKAEPDFPFLQVASLSGELLDCRGWYFGGQSKREPDSILERGFQIDELKQGMKDREVRIEEKREAARRQNHSLEKVNEQVDSLKARLMDIEREEVALLTEKRTAEASLAKTLQRLGQVQGGMTGLEANLRALETKLDKGVTTLKAAEGELESRRESLTDLENHLQALREEREEIQGDLSKVEVDLTAKKQQLENLERNLTGLREQTVELEAKRLQRKEEKASLIGQKADLAQTIDRQEEISARLEQELEKAQEATKELRETLISREREISEGEGSLSLLRRDLQSTEGNLNQEAVILAEKTSHARYLSEEIRREYDLELESVDWRREYFMANQKLVEKLALDLEEDRAEAPDPDRPPRLVEPTRKDLETMENPDWDLIEKEVNAARKKLHSMGPVNLVAIEEYADLKERHDFLRIQSEDLTHSKDQLLGAIDEINKTSMAQFKESFDRVRDNFISTFHTLFGGGKADLILQDAEDPLESGIEIVARPPGTLLKSISLLSGGQKTMTAVALLFAIYKVKPSPFCLLDELDAPLDEANIGRFVDMLRQFTEHSQFVIITHNKRTIASADTIYGVTMQEQGVSKILSMQFNRKTGIAEEVKVVQASA